MNKISCLLIAAVLLAGGLQPALAEDEQGSKNVAPATLYRDLLPETFICTVTVSHPALERLAKAGTLPSGLPGMEIERTISRDGATTRVLQKFSDGGKMEAYYVHGMALLLNPKGNPEIHYPKSETWEGDYTRVSFPELAWVTRETYVGLKKQGEQPLYCFEGNDADGNFLRLFVHIESLMPVLLESEKTRLTYRYRRVEGGKIALPPKLIEAWEIFQKNSGQSR